MERPQRTEATCSSDEEILPYVEFNSRFIYFHRMSSKSKRRISKCEEMLWVNTFFSCYNLICFDLVATKSPGL